MSKVICCRDVGVDCDFEARGETEEEILKQCAEHAQKDHGMKAIPKELVERVLEAVHDE